MEEEVQQKTTRKSSNNSINAPTLTRLRDVEQKGLNFFSSGFKDLDMVFGGGLIPGSLVLLGGEPGSGKSTLLTQVLLQTRVRKGLKKVYVTGEESASQVMKRFMRVSGKVDLEGDLFILQSNDIDGILDTLNKEDVGLLVIDSLQTIGSQDGIRVSGGVSQIRNVALRISEYAKTNNVATFIVGHVTKDGLIAGPKYVEHMVDVVLYFEVDMSESLRIVRCTKNRYGEIGRIACYSMTDKGLGSVGSLNERLLELYGEENNAVYSIVLDGKKPIVVEVEALVSKAVGGLPRRIASGIMTDRLYMLIGILEKYNKLKLSRCDVFVNVTSGFKVRDNSVDLAVCQAIFASYKKVVSVDGRLMMIGEIGLGGSVRSVSKIEDRVKEARKLGFENIVVGRAKVRGVKHMDTIMGLD